MSYPQHFIIEGKHLGTALRSKAIVHAQMEIPYSYAYFCPCCAEVWARCPVECPEGHSPFQVWEVPCKKHFTDNLRIPGSLWLSWDKTYNDSFPEGMVKWELDRCLDYAESKGEV